MALNGTVHKKGADNGVGILKYDSDTKCIVYYRDPNSLLDHSVDSSVDFNIRTITVTVTNDDQTTFTSDEEIAILVRMENGREVEEIDSGFESTGGLVTTLRSNRAGGDDPPKLTAPPPEQFDYKYGKLIQADAEDVDQFYYFDRDDFPAIVATTDRPFFATKSARFVDTDQKLGHSEGTTTIELFAKDITSAG